MKKVLVIILVFISIFFMGSIYNFAVDKKLVEGAKKYDIAVENLEKIESNIRATNGELEYWLKVLDNDRNNSWASDGARQLDQGHIDEASNQIQSLNIQHNEAKKLVKKYEPIKKKYDKQRAREEAREEYRGRLLDVIPMGFFLGFIILFVSLVVKHHKKYKKLFEEGKITQEEFDRVMQCNRSSRFEGPGINPATGLPLVGFGTSDVGGNIRGSSGSGSTFDYYQDYRDRHRWDV